MLAAAMPAYAEEQASGPVLSTGADAANGGDIVITGSRIVRKDYSANSPILTIGAESFKSTNAISLDDTLNRLPQVSPNLGAGSNNDQSGGATTIDLRNLGVSRTLVLMDGRRMTPTTSTGGVDINMVPMSLIESVEVITGGASATYGSDAVTGVVNFKLKRNFSGVALDGQAGITGRGDGATRQLSLTMGSNFVEDRGNAVVSFEYANRDGINSRARSFSEISRLSSSLPYGTYSPNASNLPTQTAVNAVFAGYGVAAGQVTTLRALGFNDDRTIFSQTGAQNYKATAADTYVSGGNVLFNSTGVNGLTVPLRRYGAFAKAHYDVTDDITVFGEFGYQNVTSRTVFGPGFIGFNVPVTNPFIPAALSTILASRPNPTATFSVTRRFADLGARYATSETNGYRGLVGVTGKVAAIDGSWEIYASRGSQTVDQQDINGFSISAVNTLLARSDGGAGLCTGGLSLFGTQNSASCLNYIRRNTLRKTVADQDVVEATVQGKIVHLPAGDVRFSLGAGYRNNGFSFTPDAALQTGDVVSFANGAVPPVSGNIEVKEVFGELLIPILKDLPLIKQLELNLGYRYSDYNTFGGVKSYRAEGSWAITDFVRVRGGYARAVRAPNVVELYESRTMSSPFIGAAGSVGQGDPCDVRSAYRTGGSGAQVRALCLAQGMPANLVDSYVLNTTQLVDSAFVGGNPDLKAETADTFTVGGVLSPRFSGFLTGFSLSVDYYNISLKQAIGRIDGGEIVRRCYNLGGQNPGYDASNLYCGFFQRRSDTGEVTNLTSFNRNLGRIKTSGIDVSAQGILNISDAVKLRLSGSVNWTDRFAIGNFPGDALIDYAGSIGAAAAYPEWKGLLNVTLQKGGFSLGVQYRYIDAMKDATAVGVANSNAIGTPVIQYLDANIGIKVAEDFNVRFGITNLADKQPPVYNSFRAANTYPGLYDIQGRSFYVGTSVKF